MEIIAVAIIRVGKRIARASGARNDEVRFVFGFPPVPGMTAKTFPQECPQMPLFCAFTRLKFVLGGGGGGGG